MRSTTLTLFVVGALFAALARCGGKSGPSAAQKAATELRSQTIPGSNGSPMYPTSVRCKKAADGEGSDCTVVFPDRQVQDCSVVVSGNDESTSCNVNATNRERSK